MTHESRAERRRPALAFVFVTVVLDVLAMGIVIPVLPHVLTHLVGDDTARAARLLGALATTWAAMQLVCSPILGALSDRFGRRPVLLLSNLGLALDHVLMALAPTVGWLWVGRLLSGMTSASLSVAGAYVADVTPPERRAVAFGLRGVAVGVGFVAGPLLGGALGQLDPRLPFWVAAALGFANTLYGLCVLPESLDVARRTPLSWSRLHPLGALAGWRAHRELRGLGAVTITSQVAHHVLPSTFVLYTAHRYGWDGRTVGLALALVGVSSIAVQGGVLRPVIARLGERRALLLGLACACVGLTVYGLAPTGPLFLLGLPATALWGLAGPSAQGLMSARVGDAGQGRLHGMLGSAVGISGLLGPGLFSQTFARGVATHAPGAPFLLAAAMMLLALVVAARAVARAQPERVAARAR